MNAETNRKIQNLATVGTVIAVDPANAKMRLQVDDNQTDWLPIPAMASGNVRVWNCPTIGQQFSMIAQGGELSNGLPVASYYSDSNNAPSDNPDHVHIEIGDAKIIVDSATGEATFKVKKLTVDAEETIFKGKVSAEQEIVSEKEVTAKNINLTTHIHIGVESGSSTSGNPQ